MIGSMYCRALYTTNNCFLLVHFELLTLFVTESKIVLEQFGQAVSFTAVSYSLPSLW